MLTSNNAVKRAVKKEMLLVFNRMHRTVTTNTLFSRWFGSQPSVSLDPQWVTTQLAFTTLVKLHYRDSTRAVLGHDQGWLWYHWRTNLYHDLPWYSMVAPGSSLVMGIVNPPLLFVVWPELDEWKQWSTGSYVTKVRGHEIGVKKHVVHEKADLCSWRLANAVVPFVP